MRPICAILLTVLLCSCATEGGQAPVVTVPPPVDVALNYAPAATADPLNVSIALFDSDDTSRIYEAIREAEAAFLPVQLRDTLNESGFWGAVNVVAVQDSAAEVLVSGAIVESDAVTLALEIRVTDSRGKVWIDQVYRDHATDYPYDTLHNIAEDPFQDLFNEIANDMSGVLRVLTQQDRSEIFDTAMLRYAILLSPGAFNGYLQTDESGLVVMQGLPARNDPLYKRVRDLREREFAIQDIVDDHFQRFYDDMAGVYPYWRQSSYELLVYNDQLARRDQSERRSGNWAAIERVYRTYKELKLNEDELRELAGSFERELEPTVTELEGRVIELQGSLKTQYQTWRRILAEIYSETRGF